jgi:hypothetical protein
LRILTKVPVESKDFRLSASLAIGDGGVCIFRSATMTSHETAGFLGRTLTALGSALKRGFLGKSAHDYTKQFTGSDEYWDRVIAARQGWPRQETPQPDVQI